MSQAAADFAKAHLSEALRQQLLSYAREKEKEKNESSSGGLSYSSILEQQILALDRDMLDKLSAVYNEAGQRAGQPGVKGHSHTPVGRQLPLATNLATVYTLILNLTIQGNYCNYFTQTSHRKIMTRLEYVELT